MTGSANSPTPLHSLGTDVPTLVALLVCLIPTTIGALLAAIGIAGMDRALRANILAKSGKAVEVAGDVDTLLLDKTGTITIGNRQATQFVPMGGYTAEQLGELAALASVRRQTPEGKSIVELIAAVWRSTPDARCARRPPRRFPPSAVHRIHRANADERHRPARRPADSQGRPRCGDHARRQQAGQDSRAVARSASMPSLRTERRRCWSAKGTEIAGMVVLEDILKPDMRDRFERLRRMGLRTVMVTGDNPLTAKAIAAQAGVDDFIAQATPEAKLGLHPQGAGRPASWSP